MRELIARFGDAVKGVLTGFDRIVFKGTILPLAHEDGAMSFLRWRGVLNRDYKEWMQAQTDDLVSAVDRHAREQSGKPIIPLDSWRVDKEKLARKRQEQTGIDAGLIGAWSCQESCWSYRAHYCAEKGYPQLRRYPTRCKHLYLYLSHEQYGWMSVRLQTWFPYHIQIALRSEVRCQMSEVSKNFPLISDLRPLTSGPQWPHLLNSFLPMAFPTMRQTLGPHLSYYWTLWQSEWATDLIMDEPAALTATMASILRQVISDPDFTVSGMSNAALRKKLASTPWGAGRTDKQLSARITRHLRILRDHGLIRKIPNRHRYHLTDKGRQLTTALNAMLSASTEQLLDMAA